MRSLANSLGIGRIGLLSLHERLDVGRSPTEFTAELREIDVWNRANGYGPARIDPEFDPAMREAFEGLGLADMLH